MKKAKKKKTADFLFFLGVFAGFCVLYMRIVPIVIYNMDDWSFLAYSRGTILPDMGSWNPSRVLPEMLMPFVTGLSVNLLYPFLGRFAISVETGMALFVSAAVTLYAYEFYRLIVQKRGVSQIFGFLITILFLTLHFLIFRTADKDNDYLLAGYFDTTSFFFYLIPALMNVSLVFWLMRENYFWAGKKSVTTGAAILFIAYFCIFSNLYQSAILPIYMFTDAAVHLLRKEQRRATKPLDYLPHLLILAAWIISLVFESGGGRAGSVGMKGMPEFLERLKAAVKYLLARLNNINRWFLVLLGFSVCVFVVYLICRILNKKRRNQDGQPENTAGFDWHNLILCGIILLYEVLLCAVSVTSYVSRGDVLICCFAFLFLFICDQMVCIYRHNRKLLICLPLITFMLIAQTITPYRTWTIRTNNRIDAGLARKITDSLITECIRADQNGEDSVEIHIPKYSSKDNWPLSPNGENAVPGVLYKYNITAKRIQVTFIKDIDKNREYGLPIPE